MNVIIDGVEYVPRINIDSGSESMPFREYIRGLRINAAMTLDEAAKKIGCSKSYIWELENKRSEPSLRISGSIATAYGVSVAWLYYSLQNET